MVSLINYLGFHVYQTAVKLDQSSSFLLNLVGPSRNLRYQLLQVELRIHFSVKASLEYSYIIPQRTFECAQARYLVLEPIETVSYSVKEFKHILLFRGIRVI